MPEISFDFKAYIEKRKGTDEALARSGAPYAYPGDQRVLRTLNQVTPVRLAVEGTGHLWKTFARNALLKAATRVKENQFSAIHHASLACAIRLQIPRPTIYITPQNNDFDIQTLGSDEESCLFINGVLVDHLSPDELRFVIGQHLGHLQNNHVGYLTALYYLTFSANQYLRWIVSPAVSALGAWQRRAQITSDRAGLICNGEMDTALSALIKLGLGSVRLAQDPPIQAYLQQLKEKRPQEPLLRELLAENPFLQERLAALQLFSQTHYYLKAAQKDPLESEGNSLSWCDAQVRQVLSGHPSRQKPHAKPQDPQSSSGR
jgi:Zn-dependent protease with chaperone function